jgi:hypothetical protein
MTENIIQRIPFGQVPIVVGVTGHRDIPPEDVAALEAAVIAELQSFSQRYPSSPLLLISGLAEGADRLVAECALRLGWSVGAVLALPRDEFEKDFSSSQSLGHFDSLLKRCIWVREAAVSGTPRPDCYEAAGFWIARQAQWLIALYDGQPGAGRGGSAEVVRIFREGLPSLEPVLPDAGPVIHILTRRLSAVDRILAADVATRTTLNPCPGGLGDNAAETTRWVNVLSRIDEFNALSKKILKDNQHDVENSRSYLDSGRTFSDEKLPAAAVAARCIFGVADVISTHAQRQRNRLFVCMIVLSVLAVLCEQLYSGPLGDAAWLLVALLFVGLATLPIWLRLPPFLSGSWKPTKDLEALYLDCRSLAEACRVQYYWKISGVAACAAENHLQDQRDELEWIRQAVRSTELVPDSMDIVSGRREIEKISVDWIVHQMGYFIGSTANVEAANKSAWHLMRSENINRTVEILLIATVGGQLAVFGLHTLLGESTNYLKWLQWFCSMLLALAAAFNVWGRTQAHVEHARSYSRMGLTMRLAALRLGGLLKQSNPFPVAAAREVIHAAGLAALDENGDWLLLHRDRPPGPSIG